MSSRRRKGRVAAKGGKKAPKRAPKRKAPPKASKRGSVAVARAEKAAGGMRALARKLKVSPSTINRWRREGLTKAGRAKLETYKRERSEVRKSKREHRRTFEELMRQAQGADIPEHKRLPQGRSKNAPRRGPLTQGWRYTRAWNRMLTEGLIEDITAWLSGLEKRYPIWQAVTVVSQYGKGAHRGYKTVYFQLPHAETGDFAISAQIPTRKSTVRENVVSSMEERLQELMEEEFDEEDEDEVDEKLQVYVHSTTMFNYRMRTERERQQFVTRKRNERRKQWAKKQKQMQNKSS